MFLVLFSIQIPSNHWVNYNGTKPVPFDAYKNYIIVKKPDRNVQAISSYFDSNFKKRINALFHKTRWVVTDPIIKSTEKLSKLVRGEVRKFPKVFKISTSSLRVFPV